MSRSIMFAARIRNAIARKASAGGIGFAGTSGLIASGLTDIASVLGPILAWFFVLASMVAVVLAVLIERGEKKAEEVGQEPRKLGFYCHSFLVLLGALFGSGVLLVTGYFQGDNDGSRILAVLSDTKQAVERVETKVGDIDEQVGGIGQKVLLRDISGRSGTGMISDVSTFQISMENERLMKGARCSIELPDKWKAETKILSRDCAAFKVRLSTRPILDAQGQSAGDIVQIPYTVTVTSADGAVLGTASGVYPFYNNYRTIRLALEPGGNRLKVNERRRVRVVVPDAEIPEGVECDWNDSTNPVIKFISASDNNCSGWLSTEVDKNSYPYKDLMRSGAKRGNLYVQLVTSSDFKMLGIREAKFSVSK